MGTGLNAGGGLAGGQSGRTHVALPHDSLGGMVFGHIVGTGHRAILATKALIVEVFDDASGGIFLIGVDGTRRQTGRLETMVTGGGDVLQHRQRTGAADEQSHVAPGFAMIESIERVAGGNARLATAASIEIDRKAILLSRSGGRGRQKRAIVFLSGRR